MAKLDADYLELIQEIRRSGTYKKSETEVQNQSFDYKLLTICVRVSLC